MSLNHTGNVQPSLDNEEHTHISGVAGKKVFNIDSSGNVIDFDIDNAVTINPHTGSKEVRVFEENHLCVQNTSTTPLAGGATFTGVWEDCLNYQEVNVSVVASHDSASNGLVFQWSADGSTIGDTDTYSFYASSGGTNYTPNPAFRYFRIVYTNGATPQTSFSIQTILRRQATGGSFHRIDSTLKDDSDGRLRIVVPKLRTAQNNYISQTATSAGNAKVSLEEVNGVSVPVTASDDFTIDAFGRARTSQTGQRFDLEFIYNKQPLIVDDITSGSGSNTHNANARDVVMANGGTGLSDYAFLYSHYDVPYTAGNSQLIDITGTLDNAAIGSGTAQLYLRSTVSGTTTTTTYDQDDWNKNTASTVDWTKSQILMMDFQSLKIGRIRFYLVRNGIPVFIHQITNDNIRATGYWQSPTLPISWTIYNDADNTYMEMGYGDDKNGIGIRYVIAKNASATMRAVCATVKSEGGQPLLDMNGYPFTANNAQTAKTVSTTLIPLLSIQMASTFNSLTNRGLAIPMDFDISTNNPIRYEILYRPTLTGPSWSAVGANSFMNYDVTASAVTGGVVVDSGYVSTAKNLNTSLSGLLGRTIMSLGRTATSDILTIAAIRTSGTDATVLSALKWKEIR